MVILLRMLDAGSLCGLGRFSLCLSSGGHEGDQRVTDYHTPGHPWPPDLSFASLPAQGGEGAVVGAQMGMYGECALPDLPSPPLSAQGAKGPGCDASTIVSVDRPPNGPVGAREAVCIGQANESRLTW